MSSRLAFIIVIILAVVSIRFWLFYAAIPHFQDGQNIKLIGTITNQPKTQGLNQKFTLSSEGSLFFITTSSTDTYWYGEQLVINGKVEVKKADSDTLLTVYRPDITITTQQNPLAKLSEYIRERVSKTYTFSLDNDMKGLLIGMVFGIQQNMSPRFLQALQTSGVMHVIAASGMNITFIAGILLGISQKFSQRKVALVFTLVGVIFYTALAGFQPSIVRAAIMGGLTLLAGLLGRQSYSLLALCIAAVGMLVWNPLWLFDIGFQLSFVATAGLFFIKPLIDNFLSGFVTTDNILLADLSTTTAAQIATLPILMANFGYYNPLSIVVNLLVLWTVPFVMIIGAIVAILTFIFVPLAEYIVYLVYPLLWYFKSVVMTANSIPTVWQVTQFPLVVTIGYYCIIIGFVLLWRNKTVEQSHEKSSLKIEQRGE